MQEHHTRPHFIGKERYKESIREKEKNIKREQEMRRKTAREYKPGTILLEMKREQSNLIYHRSIFVKLPR